MSTRFPGHADIIAERGRRLSDTKASVDTKPCRHLSPSLSPAGYNEFGEFPCISSLRSPLRRRVWTTSQRPWASGASQRVDCRGNQLAAARGRSAARGSGRARARPDVREKRGVALCRWARTGSRESGGGPEFHSPPSPIHLLLELQSRSGILVAGARMRHPWCVASFELTDCGTPEHVYSDASSNCYSLRVASAEMNACRRQARLRSNATRISYRQPWRRRCSPAEWRVRSA
jgi:hypothetical protein